MEYNKENAMSDNSQSPRPLEGVTVLDITNALAGPFATLLLAGLGAKVIKVENPAAPDPCRSNAPYLGADGAKLIRNTDGDISISAINRLRNKLAVTLNLKHPCTRDVFSDLIRNADVVVENFSAGVINRLGLDYAFAREINPRIIYCSINGFGNDPAPGTGKAMDAIIQALSGTMQTSGCPEDPPIRIGIPFGDLCAPLFGVIGILAALHQVRRTGIGQQIDVSMLGVLTSLVAGEAFDILERCGIPLRTGKTVPRLAPFGIYQCKDGYVAICGPTEPFAMGVFKAMGRPELAEDERFSNRDMRVKNVQELDSLIQSWTRALPTAEVLARMDEAGTPAAEVRDPKTAVRDPRVLARRETVPLMHPKFGAVGDVIGMGFPIHFSDSTVGYDQPPPAVGQHNQAVYGGILGYSAERIEQLRAEKVI
jgi:CoA:oxalate CoA-transferase